MVIFKQGDPAWGDKQLGTSGLSMRLFGCLIADCAQALYDAGWPETPGTVIDKLNSIGGFTDNNYPKGGGLLIWAKLTEAYPQIHMDGQGYTFVQGTWGRFTHWLLKDTNGTITDPWFGTNTIPSGFAVTGYNRVVAIDVMPAPASIPVTIADFWVKVTVNKLNVRTSPHVINGNTVPDKQLSKGSMVRCNGVVAGDVVEGDTRWLHTAVSGLFISAKYTNYK